MEKINFINYSGNKRHIAEKAFELINKRINDETLFIEPFGGSGVMSLNAPQYGISNIVLNEINENIFDIHYAFKNGKFEDLNQIIEEVRSYGDVFRDKKAYYKARNELNLKYFNSKNKIDKGFFSWAISKYAINSMMRFGPNGFNQSWGFRGENRSDPLSDFSKEDFEIIKHAYKNIQIRNEDYKNILNDYLDYPNKILFLDPPYVDKNSGIYSFSNEEYQNFIEYLKKEKGCILYTDVYNEEILKELNLNYIPIKSSLGHGKVGKKNKEEYKQEVLYYNFNHSKKLF